MLGVQKINFLFFPSTYLHIAIASCVTRHLHGRPCLFVAFALSFRQNSARVLHVIRNLSQHIQIHIHIHTSCQGIPGVKTTASETSAAIETSASNSATDTSHSAGGACACSAVHPGKAIHPADVAAPPADSALVKSTRRHGQVTQNLTQR